MGPSRFPLINGRVPLLFPVINLDGLTPLFSLAFCTGLPFRTGLVGMEFTGN